MMDFVAAAQSAPFTNTNDAKSTALRRLLALAALLHHWRRHLGQLLSLIIGLSSATALFVGVQLLNAEARSSYDQAEASLTGGVLPY